MNRMARLIIQFLFLFTLIIMLTACPGPQKYPDEPQITFKQMIISDSTDLLSNQVKKVKLIFYLIDGDGNIGLKEGDTTGIFHPDSLYYFNFFTTIFEIVDGDTVKTPDDKQRNFRIPYVEPQGQVKTLMADIFIDIEFAYPINGSPPYDSIFFEFYIVDRDFNPSNLENSITIPLDTTGKFPDVVDE